MSRGSDSWYTSTIISLANDGDTYVSDEVDADEYDMIHYEPGEENDNSYSKLPSIWWVYTPEHSGVMKVDTQISSRPLNTILEVFTGPSLSGLTRVAENDDDDTGNNTSLINIPVEAGKTYYIKYELYQWGLPYDWESGPVVWIEDNAKTYMDPPAKVRLRLTGPRTITQEPDPTSTDIVVDIIESMQLVADAPDITYPPYLALSASLVSQLDLVSPENPDIRFVTYLRVSFDSPPAMSIMSPGIPLVIQSSIVYVEPETGVTVPTQYPSFTFYLKSSEDLRIEVQVDDSSTFDSPVATFSTQINDPIGDFSTSLSPSTALNDSTTYYWRYRITLLDGSIVSDWSTSRSIIIDKSLGSTTYTGSWIIGSGKGDPVVWFASPGKGQPGDMVTIYGQNIVSPASVTIAGIQASIVSSISVPESDDSSVEKIIDIAHAIVTIEHDEVVFIVPDVNASGGDLVVEV